MSKINISRIYIVQYNEIQLQNPIKNRRKRGKVDMTAHFAGLVHARQ